MIHFQNQKMFLVYFFFCAVLDISKFYICPDILLHKLRIFGIKMIFQFRKSTQLSHSLCRQNYVIMHGSIVIHVFRRIFAYLGSQKNDAGRWSSVKTICRSPATNPPPFPVREGEKNVRLEWNRFFCISHIFNCLLLLVWVKYVWE